LFHIDIESCERCGGAVKIIACIEDPLVIEKILAHLERRDRASSTPTPRVRRRRTVPAHRTRR
jgi:hypothetical protein